MSGLTRREIEAVKEDILSSFHCALPGIVEAFRPETRTADIRPAVRGRHKEELPLLQDVPVFLPAPAMGEIPWTVSPGDGCLVVFADLPVDPWLEGDETAPVPDRMHDLSDAFAFVGFLAKANTGDNGGDHD